MKLLQDNEIYQDAANQEEAAVSRSVRNWFGLSLAIVVCLLCFPFGGWPRLAGVLTAVCLLAVYYLIPGTQIAIIRGWKTLTFPLAFVMGHLLLGGIYFCILTPMGLFLRLRGRDELGLKDRPEAQTHWAVRSPERKSQESYFGQH